MNFVATKHSVKDGGHYSPGVLCGNMLYISGQLSIDPITKLPPAGGVKAETAQALENLQTVLRAAGLEKTNVAMCRVYLPDISYWSDLNEVYSNFFGEHKPARVVVPTNTLYAGCLVEIEAIAEVS
jgi:reactive intermediate/imine deaminase